MNLLSLLDESIKNPTRLLTGLYKMPTRQINVSALTQVFIFACSFPLAVSWTSKSHHSSRLLRCRFSTYPSILCSSRMDRSSSNASIKRPVPSTYGSAMTTLAGDYSVSISSDIHEHCWTLYPLHESQETQALAVSQPKAEKPVVELTCVQTEADVLEVAVSLDLTKGVAQDLIHILQLVLLQMSAKRSSPAQREWRISVGSSNDILVCDVSSKQGVAELFSSELNGVSSVEWVEMVSDSGEVLGKVPRSLVHSFNLLHRGIGAFVTKDRPLLGHLDSDPPPLYTHRRAASKRIFPSLYDMFVGGVALADEPSDVTARREIAEELGLSRALESNSALSEPILDCLVCTNLNRCLVTLFCYTMNTSNEEITWQEEEVEWGDFVPYPLVAASADRSIRRLDKQAQWPGTNPPIQSDLQGSAPNGAFYEGEDWMEWDFVPDGLLVWESWLKKMGEAAD